MKGSELLGQIIALFILIGISFVAGGIVLWVVNITETTDWGATYSLVLTPVHQPIKYEAMMLSFLETTYSDVATKNIIFSGLENYDYTLDNGGLDEIDVGVAEVNLRTISKTTFDDWFGDNPYVFIFKIEDNYYKLAGSSKPFRDNEDRKISLRRIIIPIQGSENEGELILYVRG
ncbi:MAG: hypothetical protein GOV02_00935 [Candidatus Aenigmarchaeota archaeon]|nr:hypothetical protein [Candidatus Aenigmarchaeota archaeon]